MRFSKHHHSSNSDNAVLPLTNIVFLLLIFFMLAGRLAAPQAFDITPPHSVSDANAQNRGIEVELAPKGKLALEGKPIAMKDLGAQVHARLKNQPNLPLRLKADGRDDASRVVAVMHILHRAGAHELRLITISKSG